MVSIAWVKYFGRNARASDSLAWSNFRSPYPKSRGSQFVTYFTPSGLYGDIHMTSYYSSKLRENSKQTDDSHLQVNSKQGDSIRGNHSHQKRETFSDATCLCGLPTQPAQTSGVRKRLSFSLCIRSEVTPPLKSP